MHFAVVHNLPPHLQPAFIQPLREALAVGGDTAESVECWKLKVTVDSYGSSVLRSDGSVFAPDAILSRVISDPALRTVLTVLQNTGVSVVNDPHNATTAGDKAQTIFALQSAGLQVAPTLLLLPGVKWHVDLEERYGYPLVVKPNRGMQGGGVQKAENSTELKAIWTSQPAKTLWLGQPHIATSKSCDVRVLVVGGNAIAAMKRTPTSGEWRANLHLGATGTPYQLSQKERTCAENAAVVCGLDVAGVDFLPTENGPVILEVNPNPELTIGVITGVDVHRYIADAVKASVRPTRLCPGNVM